MKYQIQKYSKSNHDDREVILESSEPMDAAQCKAWYDSVVANLNLPDASATALVVEGHQWFIATGNPPEQVEPVIEQVEPVIEQVEPVIAPDDTPLSKMERPPVPFTEIAEYELAKSAEQRKEAYDAEVRLQKHLAKLS